ncbi:glycosyl transferase family 1 [filamentous cyanobacterium CCP3]|nr:glycosyl transferase family 1 [filamentous cyanobacterium CCP3]
MKHIGLLCPPTLGHLSSMGNLGCILQQRGHQVTLFGLPDVEKKIAVSQLGFSKIEFYKIGAQDFPRGSLDDLVTQLSKLSGLQAVKFTISWTQKATEMMFQEAPNAISEAGVDFLLVDQVTVAGGTVADYLGLPFVTVCSALPLNQEPRIPPFFTSWEYRNDWSAKLRNQFGYALINHLTSPIWQTIAHQRRQWKLPPYKRWEDANSPLIQLCQLPQRLDFPREKISERFHYVGTFRDVSLQPTVPNLDKTFPFESLNSKPLIYVSLGTLQNRLFNIFYIISKACQHLDAQLVISLGGGAEPSELPALLGSPLVFRFAPQVELLKRATLTITHAGQNTVIESLTYGVPMVAIPITNDQPGIAARIAHVGVGEVVTLARLNVSNLKAAIDKVFYNKKYCINAVEFSSAIRAAGGGKNAADTIERLLHFADSRMKCIN